MCAKKQPDNEVETYTVAEVLDAFDHIFTVDEGQVIRPYDRLCFIEYLMDHSKENVARKREQFAKDINVPDKE